MKLIEIIKKKKNYLFLTIILLALSIPQVIFINNTFVDDTFIFLRFARNIVNGHGVVWNIGEDPITGFTSNIYLIICTLITLFTSKPILFLQLFNILLAIIGAIFIYKWYNVSNPEYKTENFITVVIIILSPSFQYWMMSGMDALLSAVSLILFLFFEAKYPYSVKKSIFSGILVSGLSLVRPEFIFMVFYQIFYLIQKKHSLTDILYFVFGFAILFVPFYVAYFIYFDTLLPNTYYAKTGGGIYQIWGGLEYVYISAKRMFGKASILFIIILMMGFSFKPFIKHWYVLGIAFSMVLITIVKGGDHFLLGRFFLPVVSLFLICFPFFLRKCQLIFSKYIDSNSFYLIILITTVFSYSVYYHRQFNLVIGLTPEYKFEDLRLTPNFNYRMADWTDHFIEIGKQLRTICKPDESLAVLPIGAIGYYSEMKIIDMVGLVDKNIAHSDYNETLLKRWRAGHERGNGQYILSRNPDYILINDYLTIKPYKDFSAHSLNFKSNIELISNPVFYHNYIFFPVRMNDGSFLNLFKKRSKH